MSGYPGQKLYASGLSVVLDREWPGCPRIWVGTFRIWRNFMQDYFGLIFRSLAFSFSDVLLQCKWEAYREVQMGRVSQYKWEAYCRTNWRCIAVQIGGAFWCSLQGLEARKAEPAKHQSIGDPQCMTHKGVQKGVGGRGLATDRAKIPQNIHSSQKWLHT